MASTNDEERLQLESAYRKHLDGLLVSYKSKGAVFTAVQAEAKALARSRDSSSLMSVARDLTPDMVRGWMGKYAKLPSHPFILESLTQVFEDSIPDEVKAFQDTVQKLRQLRANSQNAAKGELQRAQLLRLNGHLAFEPVSALELNLESLALGSWLSAGAAPPYTSRDVDDQVLSAIDDEHTKLLILKGPPKSGKTRSLIENLRRSRYRDSPIYWLAPTAEALDEFTRLVPASTTSRAVIVLDDLQRFQPSSSLTDTRVKSLMERGLVLCTIHESSIDLWRLQLVHHEDSTSLGPSSELIDMLDRASIVINSQFNETEIAATQSNLNLEDFPDSDYTHFPSWAASVEQLSSLAKSMTVKPFNKAVFASILDARVLFPGGIDLETLSALTKSRYRELNPNAVWTQSAWDSALELVTSGVSVGSRHAILMRTVEAADTFLLMDALWERLQPGEWEPPNLKEIGLTRLDAAAAAKDAGLHSSSLAILTQDTSALQPKELELLAYLYSIDNAYSAAKKYYARAILLGHADARCGLGNLEYYAGNLEDAARHYIEFLRPGSYDEFANQVAAREDYADIAGTYAFFEKLLSTVPDGILEGGMIFNLANVMFSRINYSSPQSEIELFELLYNASKSRGLGNENLNTSGALEMYRRNFERSAELFRQSGESGDYIGFRNLGHYFLRKNQPKDALHYLDLSLKLRLEQLGEGDQDESHTRAICHDLLGNQEEARNYLEIALEQNIGPEFLTCLIAGSFLRRHEGADDDWQGLYARAREASLTPADYDRLLEIETLGWWDAFDKEFITSATLWLIEPLKEGQIPHERNLNGISS